MLCFQLTKCNYHRSKQRARYVSWHCHNGDSIGKSIAKTHEYMSSCTGTNIYIVMVLLCLVVNPVSSHSSSRDWWSPGNSDTSKGFLLNNEVGRWFSSYIKHASHFVKKKSLLNNHNKLKTYSRLVLTYNMQTPLPSHCAVWTYRGYHTSVHPQVLPTHGQVVVISSCNCIYYCLVSLDCPLSHGGMGSPFSACCRRCCGLWLCWKLYC